MGELVDNHDYSTSHLRYASDSEVTGTEHKDIFYKYYRIPFNLYGKPTNENVVVELQKNPNK